MIIIWSSYKWLNKQDSPLEHITQNQIYEFYQTDTHRYAYIRTNLSMYMHSFLYQKINNLMLTSSWETGSLLDSNLQKRTKIGKKNELLVK